MMRRPVTPPEGSLGPMEATTRHISETAHLLASEEGRRRLQCPRRRGHVPVHHPGVQFRLLEHAGHLPQLETPGALIHAVWSFADARAPARPLL